MILCCGGSFENLNDIAINGTLIYYTIPSNSLHPNKIIKIPTTTRNHLRKTSSDDVCRPSIALTTGIQSPLIDIELAAAVDLWHAADGQEGGGGTQVERDQSRNLASSRLYGF